MIIRRPTINEASKACEVLQRSVKELCIADHQNDIHTLDQWLKSKTPQKFTEWFSRPDLSWVVAEDEGNILGVGMMNNSGKVMLLYVAPEARFKGISKQMLVELENVARQLGLQSLSLESTGTAKQFYQSCGYQLVGEPEQGFGIARCYPMNKSLMQ